MVLPLALSDFVNPVVSVLGISRENEFISLDGERDEREGVVSKADDVHDMPRKPEAVAGCEAIVWFPCNDDFEIAA